MKPGIESARRTLAKEVSKGERHCPPIPCDSVHDKFALFFQVCQIDAVDFRILFHEL